MLYGADGGELAEDGFDFLFDDGDDGEFVEVVDFAELGVEVFDAVICDGKGDGEGDLRRLLVAGVGEDVFHRTGGGAGRYAHDAVHIRPFEMQARIGDFAHFAVMEDDAALALVHGVHAAAGRHQQDEDGYGADDEGDKRRFAFARCGRREVVVGDGRGDGVLDVHGASSGRVKKSALVVAERFFDGKGLVHVLAVEFDFHATVRLVAGGAGAGVTRVAFAAAGDDRIVFAVATGFQ